MKIKAQPEDFIVEEEIDAGISKQGPYALYLLEKRGENTVELLKKLGRSLKIHFSEFSYGGRKDRHALTFQHIAIKKQRPPQKIEDKNYSLRLLGYMERPMGPDLIRGNRFTVTLRQLTPQEQQASEPQLAMAQRYGFPNYFDDQRFGAFDSRSGFLAEKLLKQHFNGALKLYITRTSSDDKKHEKDRKDYIFENWGDWDKCLKIAAGDYEKFAFTRLKENRKGFVDILRKIPRNELTQHYTSYQSFLWNEVMRRWIRTGTVRPLRTYRGAMGNYLFHEKLDLQTFTRWEKTTLPMPASSGIKITDDGLKKCYDEVLCENGLRLPMFNITKIRQAYFKGNIRSVLVLPQDMTFEYLKDGECSESLNLKLKFFLPRGSYGTMLVKRIFSDPSS